MSQNPSNPTLSERAQAAALWIMANSDVMLNNCTADYPRQINQGAWLVDGEWRTHLQVIDMKEDMKRRYKSCNKKSVKFVAKLTIREVQLQMGANLNRWYPGMTNEAIATLCAQKVNQEHKEWNDAIETPSEGEELADKVISECAYASMRGINLQAEIEKKLAVVSARTDQPERDKARGIG